MTGRLGWVLPGLVGTGSWGGFGKSGQGDVTNINCVLTGHLGLGPSRKVAGINVFCTVKEEHSYALGL